MSDTSFIIDIRKTASKLRNDIFEFQGFEREFMHFQNQLLSEYERSSAIKHPGNLGDSREDYLKQFLRDQNLIPEKYGISDVSSRVVSKTGHHSEEMDIVIYDKANNISLLKYDSCEFYPVEWVHGVIQVKSCLRNKKTIKDGLKNISSFKRLKKNTTAKVSNNGFEFVSELTRGFGVLFAYSSTLKWETTVNVIKEYMTETPSTHWPNAVVILDKGIILPFNENKGMFLTSEIDTIETPNIFGLPDQGTTLQQFYSILMDILESNILGGFNYRDYIRLPNVAGEHSYSFVYEGISEIATCQKHGQYLRTIDEPAIQKILASCEQDEPINWVKANEIAYGGDGTNEEAYKRQPGMCKIYNPDNLALSKILRADNQGMAVVAYDTLSIDGGYYLVPYVYSIRDNLVITKCPKCM